jgi:hypothetical protein
VAEERGRLAEWIGVLFGAGALVLSYLAWRASHQQLALAHQQLALAQQQAQMRLDLDVSCEVERSGSSRREPQSGTLLVHVHNTGKTAAHNVHGWLYFQESFFGPPNTPYPARYGPTSSPQAGPRFGVIFDYDKEPNERGLYQALIYEHGGIVAGAYRTFNIPVTLRRVGKASVRCRVVSNEGATFESTLEVEVPGRA